jgi:fructose-1,6-bisphosphatase
VIHTHTRDTPHPLPLGQAGGIACVGPLADERVMEVVPQSVHQKSPLFVGSTGEMKKLQGFLKAKALVKA